MYRAFDRKYHALESGTDYVCVQGGKPAPPGAPTPAAKEDQAAALRLGGQILSFERGAAVGLHRTQDGVRANPRLAGTGRGCR